MKQIQTRGIVLSRIDFGEADRIVTMLTPDRGKLRLMARGVRKPKSKLAGGIELFSTSDVTFIEGRGEIGTLISTRLRRHFGQIVKDIERVQLGYELTKILNRATEDEPEPAYFDLLELAFAALDDAQISAALIQTWFEAQLLRLAGHTPNLLTDADGQKLQCGHKYSFDTDSMCFIYSKNGPYNESIVKAARLLFSGNKATLLGQVEGLNATLLKLQPLIRTLLQNNIRV